MIRLRGVRVDPGDQLMSVRLLKIPGNYCLSPPRPTWHNGTLAHLIGRECISLTSQRVTQPVEQAKHRMSITIGPLHSVSYEQARVQEKRLTCSGLDSPPRLDCP
jgi:hypothetical protein